MSTADDEVVRREIVVEVPLDRAFATFVERFGDAGWPLYLGRYADLLIPPG